MTDTHVTMIAAFTIRDPAAYRTYEKGFFPILQKHGGSFVTFDDASVTLEGISPGGRIVLFRFPSEAAARRWYADPEYQQLSKHRRAATDANFLTMVHGLPPASPLTAALSEYLGHVPAPPLASDSRYLTRSTWRSQRTCSSSAQMRVA